MPEIKKSFTSGKMNKDLDLRLIPNGEYRDAMNIQVGTSEDSDVGTIQNIVGNRAVLTSTQDSLIGDNYTCVGSISDEKTNSIYWFVTQGYLDLWTEDANNAISVFTPDYDGNGFDIQDDYFNFGSLSFGQFTENSYQLLKNEGDWYRADSKDKILKYSHQGSNVSDNPSITPVFVDTSSIIFNIIGIDVDNATGPNDILLTQQQILNPTFDAAASQASPYNYPDSSLQSAIGNAPINESGYNFSEPEIFELYDITGIKVGSTIKGWGVHPSTSLPYNFYRKDMVVTSITPGNIWIDTDGNKRQQGLIHSNHKFYDEWLPTPPNVPPDSDNFLPNLVTHIEFSSGILQFDKTRLITGINIVNDMLFWTDGITEPKKINITRSIQGTESSGDEDTVVVNASRDYGLDSNGMTDYLIEEGNITVIKKGPVKAPEMEMVAETTIPLQGYSNIQFQINSEIITSGDIFNLLLENITGNELELVTGTLLSVTDPSNPLDELAVLEIIEVNPTDLNIGVNASDYTSTATVTMYPLNNTWTAQDANFPSDKVLVVRVNSISSGISGAADDYSLTQKEEENLLFNFKFPRFATRWKYEDGEYSTFSPFTRICFIPGNYSFHPREAYNLGMVNKVSKVILRDLVPVNLPKDVVEIEVLYKDENSPIIYSLQAIKSNDKKAGNQPKNIWNSGSNDGIYNGRGVLTITAENITYALPENQLLRPYDNVPRIALSQEIVGNRLIYGNYLQGYDIDPNQYNVLGGLVSYTDNPVVPFFQKESVKSLRQYQLGVVFMDEYGRQTPVISTNTADVTVGQDKSSKYNQITASLRNTAPDWAKYFKFYIKENNYGNNNDYYNLSLDRAYNAEDGNIWLSFPSSDRNKVTEETFLILKKQHGTSNANQDNTRYKIIALENEAPEFIKYKWSIFGESKQIVSSNKLFSDDIQNNGLAPAEGYPAIAIDVDTFQSSATNPDFDEMLPFVGNGDLAIRFTGLSSLVSEKYEVRTVTSESLTGNTEIIFKLDRVIQDTDSWVYNSDLSNTSGYDADGFPTDLNFILYKRELKEYPEFDGRFFAKIAKDSIVSQFLSSALGVQSKRVVGASMKVFYLSDEVSSNNGITIGSGNSTTGFNALNHVPAWFSDAAQTPASRFKSAFKFDTGELQSNWFIDSINFRARVKAESGSNYEHFTSSSWSFPVDIWNSSALGAPNIGLGGHGLGIYKDSNNQCWMQLSFAKVDPSKDQWTWNQGDHGTEFRIGDDANPDHSAQARIISRLSPGQEFQFKEDITAGAVNPYYKITGPVKKLNVFNHTRWDDIAVDNNKGLVYSYPAIGVNDDWIWNINGAQKLALKNWSSDPCPYDGSDTTLWETIKKQSRGARAMIESSHNRRVIYSIPINARPGIDNTFGTDDWKDPLMTTNFLATDCINPTVEANKTNSVTMEFLDEFQEGGTVLQSMNPAVFETEPLKSPDIDIYYEASRAYPTRLTGGTINELLNLGDVVRSVTTPNFFPNGTKVTKIYFETDFNSDAFNRPVVVVDQLANYDNLGAHRFRFTNQNSGGFVELKIDTFNFLSDANGHHYIIEEYQNSAKNMIFGLDWYNCYSFGNGVESNRIRDDFNQILINNGVKASSISEEDQYKEDYRENSLIFSGLYNSTGGLNNLNQFIQAEKITKDINPVYGSIQKLQTRDTDLIALCEDRVVKILANKDAVFNADGNPQLTANERVLGQTIPFTGDYGISKNPESFAVDAYRTYFSDQQRGAVLRLSRDGLTPISEYGMVDWFNDKLRKGDQIIGTFDIKKNEYNITIKELPETQAQVTDESGCMDQYADNYDPFAVNLGPCDYPDVIAGCADNPETSNVSVQINSQDLPQPPDYPDMIYGPFNFDPNANADCVGVPFWSGNPYTADSFGVGSSFAHDNSCCCYNGGCMDPCAVNYSSDVCSSISGFCNYPFTPYCNPTQDQIDNYSPNTYYDDAGNAITTQGGNAEGLGCVSGCAGGPL